MFTAAITFTSTEIAGCSYSHTAGQSWLCICFPVIFVYAPYLSLFQFPVFLFHFFLLSWVSSHFTLKDNKRLYALLMCKTMRVQERAFSFTGIKWKRYAQAVHKICIQFPETHLMKQKKNISHWNMFRTSLTRLKQWMVLRPVHK